MELTVKRTLDRFFTLNQRDTSVNTACIEFRWGELIISPWMI